jgi:prolyl-tRNA synthetase
MPNFDTGDHELNEIKVEKITGIISPLEFASDEEVFNACQCKPGSIADWLLLAQ